jgi:hypothetical protein
VTATTDAPLIVTEPGVYDMPNDVYHADPVPHGSLSSSGAKRLLPPSTPAHFRWYRDNPEQPKSCYELGSGAHTKVLGTGDEIVVVDADNWQTKAARTQRDEARAAGKVPLLTRDHERVTAMAQVLHEHPTAAALFEAGSGIPEASMFATDPNTGVMMRARADWLPTADPDTGLLILPDYKTTTRADTESLIRTVHNFRYAFQGCWYSDVIRLLNIAEQVAFVLVFQETEAPYLVHVVQPDTDAMTAAAEAVRRALDTYATCSAADHWPGYSDGVTQLPMPRWA